MPKYKSIAIFGSASDDIDPRFRPLIFQTGALLAKEKITMIYGVGDGGLMGESFRGARSQNGKVLGVTIPALLKKQCADTSIYRKGELKIVETLYERKHIMMDRADALLIAPGGWGTIDEIASLGVHAKIGDWTRKPMIFLNFYNFWDPLQYLMQNMLACGAIKTEQVAFMDCAESPDEIFSAIERTQKRLQK